MEVGCSKMMKIKYFVIFSLFFSFYSYGQNEKNQFIEVCSLKFPNVSGKHCPCFYEAAKEKLNDAEMAYLVAMFEEDKGKIERASSMPDFNIKKYYEKKYPVVVATAACAK